MPAFLSRVALAATVVVVAGIGVGAAGPDGRAWTAVDDAALRELAGNPIGVAPASWVQAPELVVLASVMDYTPNGATDGYVATTHVLTPEETTQLVADLRAALPELTGGRLGDFATVKIETSTPGAVVRTFRRNQIVVGRFRGLRASTGTLGFGGRTASGTAITSGAVLLDHDYDMTATSRHTLRAHELGHAVGLNHVDSRKSLMNRHVGASGLTEFDRTALVILATRGD